MSKALYVATAEANSGKSIVSLGLMHALRGKIGKVAYFRPIISDDQDGKLDNHIDTVLSHFGIEMNYDEAFAFTRKELVKRWNEGADASIIEHIIEKYKKLEEAYDFVLVEGTDFSGETSFMEMDLNVLIAKNLGIPALIVGSGKGKSLEDYSSGIHLTYDAFKEKEVEVIGVIANKVLEKNIKSVIEALSEEMPDNIVISVIPRISSLANPTIQEIADQLDAKILFGEDYLNNQTGGFSVGAMQLRNFVNHLHEDTLVITPGDRADVILGTLQAHQSANYPNVSGIVLTGGLLPDENISLLIEGLSDVLPILSVPGGTFSITNKIGNIQSKIYADNEKKILTSIGAFEKYVDINGIVDKFTAFESESMTPSMFQYNLVERAKKSRKHVVLPEGNDARVLQAASRLAAMDIVDLTILGDIVQIKSLISDLGLKLDLSRVNLVNPVDSPQFEDYVNTFYELRKHKNVNIHMARDVMSDVSYFGTMMVFKGDADGMVSGAAHTTQHTIRPALQFVKTKPGVSVVSSVFFMCLEDRVSVFGDCAINPDPTAEQLAEIAISSADSSLAFGIEPKVAMLSYSSGTSGKGEQVDKVRQATEIVKSKRPDLKIEGPIQYDAAVDKNIGKSKLPNSEVAGQASVLIFPDLNTGNNTYKAVQRETGAIAIGPMLQGLNAPVNDLSRGCTIEDIFNTVIITAIQAQDK
ncbi:MAG: phosphate acetyltransferase [Flavobacteriaceae bacterium]